MAESRCRFGVACLLVAAAFFPQSWRSLPRPPTRRVLCYATAKLPRDAAERMIPNIDPAQVRKLGGWGLTQQDRASFAGWSPQPSAVGPVLHQPGFLNICCVAWLYEKRGSAEQADGPPQAAPVGPTPPGARLRGRSGWVGDWYLWHAPDGPGRERPPDSNACKHTPRSWVSWRQVTPPRYAALNEGSRLTNLLLVPGVEQSRGGGKPGWGSETRPQFLCSGT